MPEHKNQIKLIALDLDGTLLTTDKVLTPENQAMLARAAAAGIEIVPATGRFYSGMPQNIRSLPFVRYAITINGAQVYDLAQDKPIARAEIPWPRAVEIMTYLDRLPVIYDCYMDNWGWMTQSMYDRAEEYAPHRHSLEMLKTLRTPVPELKAHLARVQHGVQKIQMFFLDMELRARTMEDLARRFPDIAVTTSIPRNVELNSLQAQKGPALEALARHLGLDMGQTMAFGDDLNDITMLRTAGIGVAMGNAAPAAKAAADHITLDCDHSGVAAAIARFCFEEDCK